MKLSQVGDEEIVVVRHKRHFAIAEARELKRGGFGPRKAVRVMPGEWKLQAESFRDFQRLAANTPADYVVTASSANQPNDSLVLDSPELLPFRLPTERSRTMVQRL